MRKTLLDHNEDNHKLKLKRLMGDTACGTVSMLDHLVEEKSVEPPVPVWEKSQPEDKTFSRTDFLWEEKADYYQCSAGKQLQSRRRNYKETRTLVMKASMIVCAAI